MTTTAVPKATISFSPSSHLLAVAANHLDGLSLFPQKQSIQAFNDVLLNRLSGCLDLCPTQNTIIAGSSDCSLEMVSFTVLCCVCLGDWLVRRGFLAEKRVLFGEEGIPC